MSALASAILIHGADDLRIGDVETPDPGPGEVAVRIARGGISASDLAYYKSGHFSDHRIKQPLIAGSEVSGTVIAVGVGVSRVQPGDRVAINPAQTCGLCPNCHAGRPIHCTERRFLGSAERFPPTQGGFRQTLICTESQAVPTGQETPADRAAFAGALAQSLHAVRAAGSIAGRSVYIAGCGALGLLTLLAARHAGARQIIIGDETDKPFPLARRLGADHALKISSDGGTKAALHDAKERADLSFETTGTMRHRQSAFMMTRPYGRIVQMAMSEDHNAPLDMLTSKELDYVGAFRFDDEFEWAVDLLAKRLIDVAPLLGAAMPFRNARAAFDLAGDGPAAPKVQLVFD